MNKLFEKIEGPLMNLAQKFASNKPLSVISSAFMMLLPITMIGGFTALFRGLDFGGYQAFLASSGLYDRLGTIYQFTTSFFAVYVAFAIAYQYALRYELKSNAIAMGLTAVMCFFIATPYTLPESLYGAATLDTTWHGATGLFSSIIIAFMVGIIYKLCAKWHIEIKLPEAVPPAIAVQFTSIIPAAVSAIVTMLIAWGFSATSLGSIHNAIYTIIRTPLTAFGANIFGQFIFTLFCYILWFMGIHGGLAVMPISMVLFTQLQMENQMAYAAGQPLPNWVTGSNLSVSSGSLAVVVACLLVAKSDQINAISRTAIIPSMFGVDEPAYFGLPMILNPIFFLPWVVIQTCLTTWGTYLLQAIGVLGYYRGVSAGSFVPFFVSNLAGYGVPGLIWGFVIFAIDVIISIPFVAVYDKQLLAQEKSNKE